MPLQVLNPTVAPGQEWWLDAEAARAAAAFPLGSPGGPPCSGALTFTLRPGAPIHLTREQVGLSYVEGLQFQQALDAPGRTQTCVHRCCTYCLCIIRVVGGMASCSCAHWRLGAVDGKPARKAGKGAAGL